MGTRLFRVLAIAVLIMVGAAALSACGSQSPAKTPLRVYNADSLIIPFQIIEKQYELLHPDVDVIIEGHGSIQVIRAATELGDDVDVAAVADSQLIRLLMYDTPMPEKNGNYADWCINFATNSIGIAYTDKSRYANELSAGSWYQIMSRPDVKIGLSDPRIDSLGYRTLMVMRLAESYYSDDQLLDRMIGGAFNPGLNISNIESVTTITVPEILKPAQSRIVLRTYSLQILALLESGDVDYSFEYESVARQHGFRFLPLPAAIDLSSKDLAGSYGKVRVTMEFQRFASVNPKFPGAPIVYGVTIPNNAKNPLQAAQFIQYLLSPEGREVFNQNYQPSLFPATCDNPARLSDELRSLFK